MQLILIRHGETEENKLGIVQGHMQGNLSKEGIVQAKKLADRLKDYKIDAIFSSDLKRAVDTARMIAKYHPEAEFVLTEELREGNAGSWTGKNKKDIDWENRPSDSEKEEELRLRSRKMIDRALMDFRDKTVIFIGHNGINKAMISVLLDKSMKDIRSQHNTAINIFELEKDKKPIVLIFDSIEHLR